ncbi:glycosyltransferase family 2 protein [Leptospira levettii]|uniref:glycosyltransferase family 2 protein n=1 Tax=Leptospira levettii TaxID=2023178 RepID=UPI000C2A486C|nr:glycosyltransferase family 2 protein [Leptospira levettii]MCW7472068.1 glycosyltransferase [Leptospira levettii]PJZ89446.1 hypothetical protein CH368_06695 [Leptospira levettii]
MENLSPLISIITINKNNLLGLKNTFESVLSQVKKNFEWIVIDGNSSDGSVEFLKENAHFIQELVIEEDKGIYDAQNKGILKSKGTYLLFLNSGDILHSIEITKKMEDANFKEDIIYGDINMVSTIGIQERIYPSTIDFDFFSNEFLCHQAVFTRKNVFLKLDLFSLNYKFCSDQEFFYKVWKDKELKKIHFPCVIVDYDMNGLSSNPNSLKKLTKEIFKIRLKLFPVLWKFYFLFHSLRLKMNSLWK